MGKIKRIIPLDLLVGRLSVPISMMADQEYCELKVDLELRHPDVEEQFHKLPEAAEQIEALDRGREFHEDAAAEAGPILPEDLPNLIRSRQPFTLVEFFLEGYYGKLFLRGRPDAIHFNGKGTAWIVELKTGEPYIREWHDAQVRLYGYLLQQQKLLKVHQLFLVCIYIDAEIRDKTVADEDRMERLIRMICAEPFPIRLKDRRFEKRKFPGFGKTPVSWVAFPYSSQKAQSELKFLTGYWLGKRSPKPTTKPWKCKKCRVNALGLCSVALVPPNLR